jgi:hypothetical protein
MSGLSYGLQRFLFNDTDPEDEEGNRIGRPRPQNIFSRAQTRVHDASLPSPPQWALPSIDGLLSDEDLISNLDPRPLYSYSDAHTRRIQLLQRIEIQLHRSVLDRIIEAADNGTLIRLSSTDHNMRRKFHYFAQVLNDYQIWDHMRLKPYVTVAVPLLLSALIQLTISIRV